MDQVKRILVVDDHFEMLEFLRSMLELSSQEYNVLGVPSAEEGFLEMRRTPFDLLITDLRLPGMSGFELIRKVKAAYPDLPIIMITGYSSDQGKEEAQSLGVYRYFQKPLDTDGLLAAVQSALYGKPAAPLMTAVADPIAENPPMSADVARRLEMLRADTGARHVLLTSLAGQVLFQSGDQAGVDMQAVAPIMAANLDGSFQLSSLLGSDQPFTIQYQAGQAVDMYCANVGRRYLLALFFDAQSRRGRIGTVWVFAQRAIKDMLEMVPAVVESAAAPAAPVVAPPVQATPPEPKPEPTPPPPQPEPEPESEPELEPQPEPEATPVDNLEDLLELDNAEIQALLQLEIELPPDDLDLDAFWEDALGEGDQTPQTGMSFEEAMRQGLVSFDEEEK